jgi:cytoskeletal protein CcmA (bactofilin family)
MAEQNQTNQTNQTVIGAGARFKGELTLSGGALIQGTVEGSITAEGPGELKFAAQSQTRASVRAATVLIEGQYDGDVLATERLQLTSSARVTGEVVAAAMIVAEGATFAGKVAVGPDAVAASSRSAGIAMNSATNSPTNSPMNSPTNSPTNSAMNIESHARAAAPATPSALESKPASRTSVRLPDWAAANSNAAVGESAANRSDWVAQTTGRTGQKSASAEV